MHFYNHNKQKRRKEKARDALLTMLVALDTSQLEISMLNASALQNTNKTTKDKEKKGGKEKRECPDLKRSFILKEEENRKERQRERETHFVGRWWRWTHPNWKYQC
jgi:hypothetical protein